MTGDNELGLEELKSKAEAGDAKAQYDLGALYLEGCGVKQDFGEAAKWYMKALEPRIPSELSRSEHMSAHGDLFESYMALNREIEEGLRGEFRASTDEKRQIVTKVAKFLYAMQRDEDPAPNILPDPANDRK